VLAAGWQVHADGNIAGQFISQQRLRKEGCVLRRHNIIGLAISLGKTLLRIKEQKGQ